MDIEQFSGDGQLHALATAADLHEYTYLIAGCVGEFWTRLGFRHVEDFAELPADEMLQLGTRYGTGLQLVNILRDVAADFRLGRCYFPAEDLVAVGLKPTQIMDKPEHFWGVYTKWLKEAERGLNAGMQYVASIGNRRVRGATALPALIGARTLALLRATGSGVITQKVKVPRQEVRGMISSVAITLARRQQLERMFRKLSR